MSARARVVVTDHVFADLDQERAILEAVDADLVEAPGTGEEELIDAVEGADAILVCFAQLPARVIDAAAASGCKVISRYGIGYDNIDVAAATRNNILVTYVPDYCLDEVADHTMALLLALSRGVIAGSRTVESGGWEVPHGEVRRLAGQRMTVVGVGGIGARVISRARPFGFEITGFDPGVSKWEVPADRAESLQDAVAEADVITLHAPLTDSTRHLIDGDAIASMSRSPIVVNTARGGLVDLEAATAALQSGALGGLALDVTEVEPLPAGHPLRTHPHAAITPHMAFYSEEAQAELQRRAATEVARALTGDPPDRPVNPEVVGAPRADG